MYEIFKLVFLDQHFLSAFFQTIIIILLGFIFRRKQIIGPEGKSVLTTLVWKLSVPCFAFNAFMQDFDIENFRFSIKIFLLAILLYILLILLGQLVFSGLGKTKAVLIGLFFAIGQTTLFSMPILQSIYQNSNPESMLYISTISIVFRIFVYIVSFFIISGEQIHFKTLGDSLKKIFLTPIMIGMILGILVFIFQNQAPFLRIDRTMPVPYYTVKSLAALLSPLAMFLIGITIGESKFKDSFTDVWAWAVAFCRNFIAPVIVTIICVILHKTGIFTFTQMSLISVIIGFSAPMSVTLSVMCLQYNKEAEFSSRACLISTLLTIISMPLMFVVCHFVWIYVL